ncbi:amidohydrolase family protein [Prosthecomicrobium sp. N25]|uniref:amidohydrolase family protein n=1 Tax=Prosthecomicrobium sp. N25 TaxID=3129254 RepID=UPI0030769A22
MDEVYASAAACGGAGGLREDVAIRFADGVIREIASAAPPPGAGRTLVLPGLVNAHDHARPRASAFGAVEMPLETWILRNALCAPPEAYAQAAAAMARSARAGIAAMMIHYTKPSGRLGPVDEAREIARAAGDVGIRIAFAPAVRDVNPIVYGDAAQVLGALEPPARAVVEALFVRQPPTPAEYVATVEEIAAAMAGPTVDVQFGPAGVQWCSPAMLEAIAQSSARTGRRIHMHLLETVHQRAWADRAHPEGIVAFLDRIGLLSDRLTLAHCVHARPDELDLIAERGVRIVTNFSSNLHLRSGIGPIREAVRRGCRVGVGLDGLAFDEDDDAVREYRLVRLAHGGHGFDATWTPGGFLEAIVATGRSAVGAPGPGVLEPGAPADFVVLDLDRLDGHAYVPVDPLAMLFARGNAGHVREVYVAGRRIVAGGTVTGVDAAGLEARLMDGYRASVRGLGGFAAAWPDLSAAAEGWFRSHCGCG